jgi:uracil-DNA glycosylase family 4
MMTGPYTSIKDANHELRALVGASGLSFDCGSGGNINSTIAIVAEAPGERELQQGIPLIGGSGKYLWDILRKDKLTRNDVYITNVVKRKLVSAAEGHELTDKQSKITLSKQERANWRHILLEELGRLPNLQFVVALGGYALQALVGYEAISKARGSVWPIQLGTRTVQVLATYNPAHVMREPRMEIVFRFDLDKLSRLRKGEFHVPRIDTLINPTFREALDALRYLDTCQDPIAYDIETMANETACVGFAPSNEIGICINFRSQGTNHFTLQQERDVRLAIQRLLMDKDKKFITQNGHYDAAWLWYKDRIRCHGHWFDTMLAHHTLYPPLPHDLGFITAQYTDHPYYKDEGKLWKEDGDIDAFWEYNVKDCCITRMASEKMAVELETHGLSKFFHEHVMRLQPHLIEASINGVMSDVGRKDKLATELGRELEVARGLCQAKARECTGIPTYELNPNSPAQLADLFFNQLQLVGRGTSTDAENRQRISRNPRTSRPARELVEAIDAYKEQAKFVSTYIGAEPDTDGRWRCTYKQTGVSSAPGRLSSAQTHWHTGLNFQNIPENAKDMFIAPMGWEFSYYDMSQIEARIVAFLADIPVWKTQFENARLHPGTYDAHCALASDMFKVPYEQVPRKDRDAEGRPTIRYVAKRCRHGLNYRMAPDKLATVTGLSHTEADRAYRLYHMATPEITVWWDDAIDLVRRNGSIHTCLGRRWLLMERFDPVALDSIIAFEPQSINGDHTSSVIYKCHADPEWPPTARIVINVHDANIALNRIEDGPTVRAIMKHHAEQPIWINSIRNRLHGIDRPEPLVVPAEMAVSRAGNDGIHRWSTIEKL